MLLCCHMDIKYIGHSCFQLKSKLGSVVTDPFDVSTGLKLPALEADIVTVSHGHADHNFTSTITGDPLIIEYPGEYERNGVRVYGYESYHDDEMGAKRGKNTLFKIVIEDINILHCGDLGHMLTEETLEEIDVIDILLIPVGGFYTIGADEAVKIISKIEPSIVIPMHYKTDQHSNEIFKDVAPVSQFLEKIGAPQTEPEKKLTLKKSDLTDQMRVIVMET